MDVETELQPVLAYLMRDLGLEFEEAANVAINYPSIFCANYKRRVLELVLLKCLDDKRQQRTQQQQQQQLEGQQ